MRELTAYLGEVTEKTLKNIIEVNKETAKDIWGDVVSSAPYRDGDYVNSIQISPTEVKDGIVRTEVYSDLTVKTKTGEEYVLGELLEYGTDPHSIPNAFGWGDKYGYDSERYKKTLDPNWHPGTISQPHWKTAMNKNEDAYFNRISKAIGGK